MGQKLEKLSEKDEESLDNSDLSGQTAETEEQDDSFATPQDTGRISGIGVNGQATRPAGELTVNPASTDPQSGQPIRPLGQQEHSLNSKGERVGGDRENRSVAPTVEEAKTVLRPKEARQTSNRKRGSESKAVVCTGTTAMEEQGNGKKPEIGRRQSDLESETVSCDPTNEEDFVLLEGDETWMPPDGENSTAFDDRIKRENPQSSIKRRAEVDASGSYRGDNRPQTSRYSPQEKGTDKTSRRNSDTTDCVEAHAKSSTNACFEREMGQHLPEVTGSRCRLKGVSHVRAAHTETTGRGEAERELNVNEHSKRQVSANIHNRGWEEVDPSLKESEKQDKESHNSGSIAAKTQVGANQPHQSRFAGAVSKRAKAGTPRSYNKKEDSQVLCNAASSQRPKPPSPETQPLQDDPSISLEQCDLIPCPSLGGNESTDEKKQIASLKRESEIVCFSAVVTPPPVTHWLPKRNTSTETETGSSVVNSEPVQDTTHASSDVKDGETMPKEKPKAKGPPPPVAKKPKNPFIKLKTAQLMSTDVQRRGKDHLRSEERVKRRHTFHFNKDPPSHIPLNQDMCVLWDERGTYTAPTNRRPLSVDLSPWEHLSLGHMDDRYGDMIDFDYCVRMANLSPEEDLQNFDMLERRVFLERRNRFKSSPTHVPKRPQNNLASAEALDIPEVPPDTVIQRQTPACSRNREIYPAVSERLCAQVSDNNHGVYEDTRKDMTDYSGDRDAGSGGEVDSYKPVAEIIRETNQLQRHQGRVKPEGAKAQVRVAEQSPSVKVSQMKTAFDVPKKSRERPPQPQTPPKKGKDFVHV